MGNKHALLQDPSITIDRKKTNLCFFDPISLIATLKNTQGVTLGHVTHTVYVQTVDVVMFLNIHLLEKQTKSPKETRARNMKFSLIEKGVKMIHIERTPQELVELYLDHLNDTNICVYDLLLCGNLLGGYILHYNNQLNVIGGRLASTSGASP